MSSKHEESMEEAARMLAGGGTAFPAVGMRYLPSSQGLSLRDWFAGMALQALVQKAPLMDRDGEHGPKFDKDTLQQFRKDMAESAYSYAEWMLEARKS